MYSAKKHVDHRIDIQKSLKFLGMISPCLYLAEHNQQLEKKVIVKVIALYADSPQFMQVQENILRKIFSSSLSYFKPESYEFRDNALYLCTGVQHLSLQSLLWIHKRQEKAVSRELVKHFTVRNFYGLARLKSSDIFPQNLKPSNLFLQEREGQRKWVWGEAGLHTNNRCQPYIKINLQIQGNKSSTPPIIDPFELEYYSLGIMLLQMITLQPVQDIDKVVRAKGSWDYIKNFKEASEYYGKGLINIIRYLIDPPNDKSLSYAIQQYEKYPEEEDDELNYQPYYFTPQRLERYLKDELLIKIQQKMKEAIADKSISVRQLFDILQRLDPQFHFGFTSINQFEQLINFLGVKLQPHELLFVSTFFYSNSLIRYFRILQRVFPAKDLIDNIIRQAVETTGTFKDFFESQTEGRTVWKAEELAKFLQKLDVPFEEKDVAATVRAWSGSDRTSIKYEQIYKYFKPILGLGTTSSFFDKSDQRKKSQLCRQQEAKDETSYMTLLLEELMKKEPDLIAFFRRHDLEQNWIVDHKIEKILRSYVKLSEQVFKKAFEEMWIKGSIPGNLSKKINYVYLLRNLQIYDNVTLLRMIITQKVNESDRQSFFQKYKKDQKGWNYLSIISFDADQNLEFQERELKALFSELDRDNSGSVDQKELYFRLTGLKEFDYQSVSEDIKNAINRQGLFLFESFRDIDPKARLILGQASQLDKVLESIGVELSQDHLNQLYQKFAAKGKFQYLSFLLEYYSPVKLFLAATKFVIEVHYKNHFDKLFQIGLRDGKKKWNRQSLTLINQELILGFRQPILADIWDALDPSGDGSLTKSQIAKIFSYRFEQAQELTYKPLQSIHDVAKRRKIEEEEIEKPKASGSTSLRNKTDKQNNDKNIIEEFGRLGQRKMQALPLQFFNQSQGYNGKIDQEAILRVFTSFGLKFHKTQVAQILNRFKIGQNPRTTINYISFYFFVIDSVYCEDFPQYLPRLKGNLCVTLIKEIKRKQSLTNADLFSKCRRKDKMRLSDFEDMFKDLVQVQVYGDDLQEAWRHWGKQQFLTLQDFDEILETNEYKQSSIPSTLKEKSQRPFKLSEENKMKDFISGEGELDMPELKNMVSFGEKDNRFERGSRPTSRMFGNRRDETEPSSRGEQRRDSRADRQEQLRQEREEEKLRMQKQPRTRNEREQRTSRFGGVEQKKKSLFPSSTPVEQKIELEQVNQRSRMRDTDEKGFKSTKSKTQLFQLLQSRIEDNGDTYINQLFAKTNIVESKRFVSCLSINYNFSQADANALAEYLATFGKIKLAALQTKLTKKEEVDRREEKNTKSKEKKRYARQERQGAGGQAQFSPGKDRDKGTARLIDPRRQKVNVPLVRQHIKILITTFCKRFEPSQLQGYFFSEKDYITRDDFSTKCQSISSTFTPSICQKIFDYLKPDTNDRVGIFSFKLAMGLQEQIQGEEQEYLPQDLQKQLRYVFQKADKDHSGFIESNQIQTLLSSLGFNESVKEIENYFARIDQNFDNKISYAEFRHFIEDQILPQLSTFDEEQEQLQQMLKNNDIFRHGSISAQTLQALLERYGVKFSMHEIQILVRSLNPEGTDVNIQHFMNAVRDPTLYTGKTKGIIYKIRLRKKVQLREIQKVFENISSCFVMAYTAAVIYRQQLSISSPYRPTLHESALFYNDLPIKDLRKATQNNEDGVLGGELNNSDLLVELLLKQVSGVPIPQKAEIKGNINKRYMNICLFDLSSQAMKSTVWQVEAEWDTEVEDVWRFSNNVRSVIVKVAGYDPRKYQKFVLLFELVMVVVESGKTLEINCGCTNIPLRELMIPEGKTTKTLKLIAGLPNKSKEIDRAAISKRTGWKSFFGSDVDSQLQMELVHHNKFKDIHRMIVALPPQVIVNRKAIPYLWTYRQFIAECAFEGTQLNRFLATDLRVLTFLFTMDVPDLFSKVWLWWKDKAETKIKTLKDAKIVFKTLMQQLYLIVHSKQFQLLKKYPSKQYFHNKSLISSRGKLISEALDNVEAWLQERSGQVYKRRKNYNLNYGPLQMQEVTMPREHINFMESLARLSVK